VPLDRLRLAVEAGLTTLGENRVQEAVPKVAGLPDVRWHLVGHLQSNKAALALRLFDVVQSVDSLALARRLDRLACETPGTGSGPLSIYLQVNVDDDPAKAGFTPDGLGAEIDAILALPGLEVLGLMTVGRLFTRPEEARPTFARLRHLRDALRPGRPALGEGLSMGMTDDFEVAVEEGSTLVRVGRAIFGERAAMGAQG
jgi:PLP dependent protein